jgi:uncharacterized membrane protein
MEEVNRVRRLRCVLLALGLAFLLGAQVLAAPVFRGLALYTPYPDQIVRAGESVTLSLTVRNFGLPPQVVRLEMTEVAPGWRATFLAGGRVVSAVYVLPDQEATVSLRLDPPRVARSGTFRFGVAAVGQDGRAQLPLRLTLGQALPPRISLTAELPTLRGPATSSFRFRVTLRNDSDQELLVRLDAEAPRRFQVSFTPTIGTQQVTSLPVKAGESRDLDVEVNVPQDMPAGRYSLLVRASAAGTSASLPLALEITGRPELSITAPDGRLSGRAYAGQETPLKILVKNDGSAPARNVTLSSSPPSGWDVKFDPERIEEIAPKQQVEVTARIRPSPRAIAGDYMVAITASAGDVSKSEDFRITVLTRTLWGVVGVILIAAALLVVGQAVSRYGRR